MTQHPDCMRFLAIRGPGDWHCPSGACAIRVANDVNVIRIDDIDGAEATGLTTVEYSHQAEGAAGFKSGGSTRSEWGAKLARLAL